MCSAQRMRIFYRNPAGYIGERKTGNGTRRKEEKEEYRMGCCVLLSVVHSPPPPPPLGGFPSNPILSGPRRTTCKVLGTGYDKFHVGVCYWLTLNMATAERAGLVWTRVCRTGAAGSPRPRSAVAIWIRWAASAAAAAWSWTRGPDTTATWNRAGTPWDRWGRWVDPRIWDTRRSRDPAQAISYFHLGRYFVKRYFIRRYFLRRYFVRRYFVRRYFVWRYFVRR